MNKKLRLTDFLKSVMIVALLFFSQIGVGQDSESITNLSSSATFYATRTWIGDNGIADWSATDARADQTITGKAITIKNGNLIFKLTPAQLTSGIGSLTLKAKAPYGSDVGNLQLVINGTNISSKSVSGSNVSNITWTSINVSTITSIVINQTTNGSRITIDDISWTGYSSGCTPPTTQSTLAFSSVTSFQMGVALSGGNGAGRVVVMNTADVFTAPTNGTNPTANATYGGGQQVVYNGTGSSFSVTGLNPLTTYYFRSYDYCDTERNYNATAITYNQATLASTNPVLSVSGSLSHGSVCPSTAATPITYTITNNGINAADGITIDSDNLTEFVISGLSSTSVSGNGGTVTYVVTFTPSSAGAKSANLTITSTTGGSNVVENTLTGTGVVTPPTITTPTSTTVTYNSAILG